MLKESVVTSLIKKVKDHACQNGDWVVLLIITPYQNGDWK